MSRRSEDESLLSSPVQKRQTRVCLSSSSQFLVSGGLDNCVHIWDLKTKKLHRSLKVSVRCGNTSSEAPAWQSPSAVGLDLNSLCVSQDHKEEVTCVSFNANDSAVASGSTSGDLVLHSLTTNVSSKAFGHGSNQVSVGVC